MVENAVIERVKAITIEVEDQNGKPHIIQYSNFVNIKNEELDITHNYKNLVMDKCKICISLECDGYSLETKGV